MKLSLLAFMACILVVPARAAPEDSAEAKAVVAMIEQNATYDNAGETDKSSKDYAPNATIIDSIAPYIWSGPNAYRDWWAASGNDLQKNGLTEPSTKLQPARSVRVEGNRAYAIFPVIFAFKSQGKPGQVTATLTYSLVKIGGRWLIAGWSYSEG